MASTLATLSNKKIHSAYSKKERVKTLNKKPSRTKQQFKDECDINIIISRYLRTGQLDHIQKLQPRYGDVTGIEYQDAMLTVAAAQTLFNELPAKIRDRFENEPAQFLEFVQDDKNRKEAEELGLLKPVQPTSEAPATPLASPPGKAPSEAPKGSKAPKPAPGTGDE